MLDPAIGDSGGSAFGDAMAARYDRRRVHEPGLKPRRVEACGERTGCVPYARPPMSKSADRDEDLPPEFAAAEVETWSADVTARIANRKHLVRWLVVAGLVAYLLIGVLVEWLRH